MQLAHRIFFFLSLGLLSVSIGTEAFASFQFEEIGPTGKYKIFKPKDKELTIYVDRINRESELRRSLIQIHRSIKILNISGSIYRGPKAYLMHGKDESEYAFRVGYSTLGYYDFEIYREVYSTRAKWSTSMPLYKIKNLNASFWECFSCFGGNDVMKTRDPDPKAPDKLDDAGVAVLTDESSLLLFQKIQPVHVKLRKKRRLVVASPEYEHNQIVLSLPAGNYRIVIRTPDSQDGAWKVFEQTPSESLMLDDTYVDTYINPRRWF